MSAKDFIEYDFMEEFHWLPQDIAKIPYKTIRKIMLIRKHKNDERSRQMKIEEFKRQHGGQTQGRGQMRRTYREV